ncbi:RNA polymerase sigma factor [Butyrivibrio sp. WCD3002]|uniref:RNA polymerase sigma factor n=1 Tax=Butyrivibrio sp. WCD3002 TaxID=1280676 RepID=UPI0003F93245|nr:sigma-70 family RNA polymerase sigma factor [Butyrivibrio sp. WCD3002]
MFSKNHSDKLQKLVMDMWNDDTESFAKLYCLTVDDTFNYCRHIIGDDKEARAAITEIYENVLNGILSLKDPSLLSPWLRRLSFDVCYRKIMNGCSTEVYELFNPNDFMSLTFIEQQIIFLYDVRELDEKAIANALGVSKSLVKKHLLLARDHILSLHETGNDTE